MAYLEVDASDMVEKMTAIDLRLNIQCEVAGNAILDEWKEETEPLVPLWRGYLQASATKIMIGRNPLTMNLLYDAVNRRNNYHYALIQESVAYQIAAFGHPFHHPIKGQSPYLETGVEKVDTVGLFAGFMMQVL